MLVAYIAGPYRAEETARKAAEEQKRKEEEIARAEAARRQICALRASAHRISGNDSIGWPTTRSRDWKGAGMDKGTEGRPGMESECSDEERKRTGIGGAESGLGDAKKLRRRRRKDEQNSGGRECPSSDESQGSHGLEHSKGDRRFEWRPESNWWGTFCRRGTDGKTRRIEPGLEPLVDGLPGRVGLLRGYGNAIVPQVAATFIQTVMEILF